MQFHFGFSVGTLNQRVTLLDTYVRDNSLDDCLDVLHCSSFVTFPGIRTLQCVLLKVALLLGVEIHANVTYEGLAEPPPPDPAATESKYNIS